MNRLLRRDARDRLIIDWDAAADVMPEVVRDEGDYEWPAVGDAERLVPCMLDILARLYDRVTDLEARVAALEPTPREDR